MPAPVAGLQGGTAPARAFHDFMSVAVANRPVEQFETQVPMPDWQLTPGGRGVRRQRRSTRTAWRRWSTRTACRSARRRPTGGYPQQQPMVRPDGTGEPSQQELDQAFPPQQQPSNQYPQRQPQPAPPPRQPDPLAPADPPQPRPDAA